MADETIPARRALRARVTLRTLVTLRWIALAGEALSVAAWIALSGEDEMLGQAALVIGCGVLLNLACLGHRRARQLDDVAAAIHLGFDICRFALLMLLVGGASNPFLVLVLAPLTVASTLLSRRSVAVLTAITVGGVTLATLGAPLPDRPDAHAIGAWAAVGLAALFIAAYNWWVATAARRISDALATTGQQIAEERRIAALGALAAAAAHELGSPLSTIAVVAREMAREVTPDDPLHGDVQLLLEQSARCREILAELSRRPDSLHQAPWHRLTLPRLIEEAALPHRRDAIALHVSFRGREGAPEVAPAPELMHGLGNILQNAIGFARRAVRVELAWTADRVRARIRDDGPGFPPHLLDRMGEPYISGRSEKEGNMGLGVFIATTLLERTGAALTFANGPKGQGGAVVTITWPRAALEWSEET